MTAYTANVTADQADYLAATVALNVGRVEVTSVNAGSVTIQIDEAAYEALAGLADDCDGHVDDEGRLWIGGMPEQLGVIHNV